MQQMMMMKPRKRARPMPTMRGMGAWSSTSIGVVDITVGPGCIIMVIIITKIIIIIKKIKK
jgi:hypothetical protein